MTPNLIKQLTIAGIVAGGDGKLSDAIRQTRLILNRAGVDPVEAVLRLARERARTYERPECKHQRPVRLRDALERYEPDPRASDWAIEAIMQTLATIDDEPTPAQLGELGRHFLTAPPRAKWPAMACELVAAIHRMRQAGRITEQKVEAVIDYADALLCPHQAEKRR